MVDNNNSKNLADQEEEKEKEKQKPTKKVWATLITNLSYLPGLLTLHYSLTKTQTRYPFIALYTSTFPQEGLQVLESRDIPHQRVPHVVPAGGGRQYAHDPRFQDTWTKLVAFSLEQYDRIVLLDGDMLIRRNMDELMDLELDGPELLLEGRGRVFAAAHACACNPLRKGHYPIHWTPENCAYTPQHTCPKTAQSTPPPPNSGISMLNSGLLVINPSRETYTQIQTALSDPVRTAKYDFPDQELLSDVFRDRWVALPYIYNALKTLRWENVHRAIWRDECVKVVHYIFAKKPWHEDVGTGLLKEEGLPSPAPSPSGAGAAIGTGGYDETHSWWWEVNLERKRLEMERGIVDRF